MDAGQVKSYLILPVRAFFGRTNLSFKVLIALLVASFISLTLVGNERAIELVSKLRVFKQSDTKSHQSRNEIDTSWTHIRGYTAYTIRRLGLKPLPADPIEPEMGKVINDVLSFKYPIDINQTESKCPQWRNRSWVDLISAYDDDMSVNRTMLIVVVSAADNFSRRDIIRKTWGNYNNFKADWLQLLFIVGSVLSDQDGKHEEVQHLLLEESNKYKDIIQVDVIDSYDKLTLKSVSLLYWALTRCPGAQLVLKCDDDTYINFQVLAKVLSEEQFGYTDRLYGVGVFNNKPQRRIGNKYYISREVWPWSKYPTFLSGGAYILGKDSIRPLLAAVQTTPLFPLEDVYLTGLCARKANIPFLSSQRIYERFVPNRLNPCFVRNTAMWQTQKRLTLNQSHEITQRIFENSLHCRSSCKYLGVC